MSALQKVVDTNGVPYVLVREIGKGGQGAVYEVEGGKLAVKLSSDTSASRRNNLLNQITQVKRLPLQDLFIARPLVVLRPPHVGYVMELLKGMVPLKTIAFCPRGESSLRDWYFSGGGLRRRLKLLARAADVLAHIHGKGLIYSDPSPHNVFISEAIDANEVRLIDADNIHYTTNPGGPSVFTPGYGAPELVRGLNSANSLTDAHAFAVVAFQTLALVHPLFGDMVANGEPEREEEALEGRFPWIEDPNDASNRSSVGIPRDIVLSSMLRELCEQTFGSGLSDPLKRPGMSEWAERLHAAASATLSCPDCRGTYFYNRSRCPWCSRLRPAHVIAMFSLRDPSRPSAEQILLRHDGNRKKPVLVAAAAITERDPLTIDGRLAFGRSGIEENRSHLELQLTRDKLSIRASDGETYSLYCSKSNRTINVGSRPAEIRFDSSASTWQLFLGKSNQLHRIVSFALRPEGRHESK